MQQVIDSLKPLSSTLQGTNIQDQIGDIATKLGGSAREIRGKLEPLTESLRVSLSKLEAQQIAQQMAPLAKSMQGMTVGEVTGMVRERFPQINIPPVNVQGAQFPQKLILKVGDQEFNAYVDGRADDLLAKAASLLNRGRK